jgi:DNA-binding response OmpR family regulator
LMSDERGRAGLAGYIPGMLESGLRTVTTYGFGHFRLDTLRRVLLSGSDVRAMPEKLFRILLLLLQANGKVVDKETFFSRVWPEESVSDGNLAQHIFLLRKFLGDEGTTHVHPNGPARRVSLDAAQFDDRSLRLRRALGQRRQPWRPSR